MTEIEKRSGSLGVETRADDSKRVLTGYAVIWNSNTTIGDYFVERIAPGAFSGSIGGDILALLHHDSGRVLGRTKSNTLRLKEDTRGLHVEIDVPNTTDGNDLWELVERGDITGMSFGMRVTKQEWDDTGAIPHRTILEAELFEVTATPTPAIRDPGRTIGQRLPYAEAIDGSTPSLFKTYASTLTVFFDPSRAIYSILSTSVTGPTDRRDMSEKASQDASIFCPATTIPQYFSTKSDAAVMSDRM